MTTDVEYDHFMSAYGGGYPKNLYSIGTGGDQAHNNMPPYWTVYIWQRMV